jgi:MFS family permease
LGNVSNAEIGAIASFYFLAYCGMQIPCGILVDKLGQKIMLMCGFSLFIIGTLSIANARNLTLIYIGSLLAAPAAPPSSAPPIRSPRPTCRRSAGAGERHY